MFQSESLRFTFQYRILFYFLTFLIRFIYTFYIYLLYLPFLFFHLNNRIASFFISFEFCDYLNVTSSLKRYCIILIYKSLTRVANRRNAWGQSSCYTKESVSLPAPIIYVLTQLTIYIYIMSSSEDAFNEVLERHSQSLMFSYRLPREALSCLNPCEPILEGRDLSSFCPHKLDSSCFEWM